jgi:DNA-directed RNA polymerase specialized sigma subunit
MPEDQDPYEIYKVKPTPQALKATVDHHKTYIDNTVFRMLGKQPSPVVRTRADLLAAESIRKYDPKSKVPLKNWIAQGLQGIHRISKNVTEIVSVPDQVRRDAANLARARAELKERLMRDPSEEELADHTGVSVKKQRRIGSGNMWTKSEGAFSAELEQGGDDADDNMPGIAKDPMLEVHDYVYYDLDDIDKQIFQYRLGYRGTKVLPNQEIARRLNISPSAVTQRATRIQRRLEETSKWL